MSECAMCGNKLRTCGKCGWSKVYEEDMMHLKQQIEKLQSDNARLKEIDERESYIAISIKKENDRLKSDNTKMRECLEWIASVNDNAKSCLSNLGSE